jgi:TetR/AcrR family transcriptional regulator, transcriptional repressor for nem operon
MTTAPPDSRTRILDAAMHLIRAKGYTATTIDDLCAAAGLTKGSFFHHFKSKEHLALAAAEHFSTMASGLFTTAPFRTLPDPLDRFLGYIDFRAAILRGNLPEYTCLLGTMVQETYESHPAIRAACEKHITAHAEFIAIDIAQAKELYAPNAPWTPRSLAFFTQAVLQGAFILAKATSGPTLAAESIAHLRAYIKSLFTSPLRPTKGAQP